MIKQNLTPAIPADSKIDLTNCEREPIHILGHVQSFGCLISVCSDWIINHASLNTNDILGIDHGDLIGNPLNNYVLPDFVHTIRGRLQMLSHADAVERIFELKVVENGGLLDVALHRSGHSIIMEFERSDASDVTDYAGYLRPMLDRVQSASSIETMCTVAARQIKAITGFDRVMAYRFAPDDSGEVIAEARMPDMEPMLGLHFPASDIPAQARALYKRSLLRIISAVDGENVPILPPTTPEGVPLDLSLSSLRAVSSIHLEYLRNMDVAASMSVSIVVRGKLWGLFACHNRSPKVLSYKARTGTELFAQMFAYVLDQRQGDLERSETETARQMHDDLMARLAEGQSILENFGPIADAVTSVIACDGIATWINGEFKTQGRTPSRDEILPLLRFLNTTAASRIFATDRLSDSYPAAEEFSDCSAGILVLPVSRSPRDYLILFRQEISRTVLWAGNPQKPAEPGPNGTRLTPRKSFETWKEIVRNQSQPWSASEIRVANSLRVTLLEVVLRVTDAASRDRERASDHQELLIAELNHRVRNILNLIRGLVAQSGTEARNIADFTSNVGGRIDALARAHDKITRENWNAASLHELLATEIDAYLGSKRDRLVLRGPDALLQPEAFSTLALVMHEMITNSAKYGAMGDAGGRIEIDLVAEDDGALRIKWQEIGGPPVRAPKRRGFGSTIIERSIPHELKGTAKLNFDIGGLRAEFMIPANGVSEFVNPAEMKGKQTGDKGDYSMITLSGHVLVVEDNLIIAMDAEEISLQLGAQQVSLASSVNEAERLMSEHTFNFAILDVNLGSQTSEPIAENLQKAGIPFAFATGYGEGTSFSAKFPDIVFIQKPYSKESIQRALAGRGSS